MLGILPSDFWLLVSGLCYTCSSFRMPSKRNNRLGRCFSTSSFRRPPTFSNILCIFLYFMFWPQAIHVSNENRAQQCLVSCFHYPAKSFCLCKMAFGDNSGIFLLRANDKECTAGPVVLYRGDCSFVIHSVAHHNGLNVTLSFFLHSHLIPGMTPSLYVSRPLTPSTAK